MKHEALLDDVLQRRGVQGDTSLHAQWCIGKVCMHRAAHSKSDQAFVSMPSDYLNPIPGDNDRMC
jgi:hypothetical protein